MVSIAREGFLRALGVDAGLRAWACFALTTRTPRGVWRAPNLILVRGNAPDVVIATSTAALAGIPHTTWPIATLTQLEGVGPATASAVVAAAAPERYPFFDELVAAQVPQLGKIAWTMGYYARYADAIRSRAVALGEGWTPTMVERALWAHVGGKAGARP